MCVRCGWCESVLAYCYAGQITVPDDLLAGIHKFAFQYQLETLQAHCETIMVKGLCASNCLELFAYFRRHTLPTLPDALERATAEVGLWQRRTLASRHVMVTSLKAGVL